jgi:membrane associated rhomboid family serine protease
VAFSVGFVLWTFTAQVWSDHIANLQFDRARYEAGAVWTLLSAQWVHFGVAHAALNAATMVLVVLALHGWVPLRLQGAALVGGYVGVALVIALDPHCVYYAGASGALHGLWSGSAVGLVLKRDHGRRGANVWMGAVMLLVLAFKLWLQAWGSVQGSMGGVAGVGGGLHLLVGVPTYYPAHMAGAIGGMVFAVLAVAVLRRATHQGLAASQAPARQ